jgi:membrane-associated protease RseP (regulator of RpoE activity)
MILVLGLSQLGAQEEPKIGWLGVYPEDLSPAMKVALSVDYGVLVARVIEDSPADSAGLIMGDVILMMDSERIEDNEDLRHFIRHHPSERVNIEILHQGRRQKIPVMLGEKERWRYGFSWSWPEGVEPPARIRVYWDEALEELRQEIENLRAELEELKVKMKKED